MQILYGQKDTSKEVFDDLFRHDLDLPDDIEELLAMDVLHQKVDALLVVKGFDITANVRENSFL